MKYVASDGKEFTDHEKALQYEREIEEKENKRKELNSKKVAEQKAINEAVKNVYDIVQRYNKNYGGAEIDIKLSFDDNGDSASSSSVAKMTKTETKKPS